MPGKAPLSAEVLNKEPLGPGVGGQAVSLSALTVTPPFSWNVMVLASALSHYRTSLSYKLPAGKTKRAYTRVYLQIALLRISLCVACTQSKR